MKKLLCLAVPFVLFAAQKQTLSVDECNKIFEQRKAEIAYQIEKLEEKEQSLSAFQNANKNVQTQKEQKLSQKLAEINKLLAEVAKKEQNTKAMLDENKKVLDAIQKAKASGEEVCYYDFSSGPNLDYYLKQHGMKIREVKKNEYGFHEFEKEYFQKAVNFKDIDVRKDRYVDIFLYLKQFAFRKGLVSLSLPHDIQEMVQKGGIDLKQTTEPFYKIEK
jgi:mevalonate pyrophosphate decarboxylase